MTAVKNTDHDHGHDPANDNGKGAITPAPAGGALVSLTALRTALDACRWPCGDPGHLDFRFCGDPVVEKPYCDHHRAMAFWPNRACSPHRVAQKASQYP
jgi:hypothetical protein